MSFDDPPNIELICVVDGPVLFLGRSDNARMAGIFFKNGPSAGSDADVMPTQSSRAVKMGSVRQVLSFCQFQSSKLKWWVYSAYLGESPRARRDRQTSRPTDASSAKAPNPKMKKR
jgi:hypothetical protein